VFAGEGKRFVRKEKRDRFVVELAVVGRGWSASTAVGGRGGVA
jgi:hypothetical protein